MTDHALPKRSQGDCAPDLEPWVLCDHANATAAAGLRAMAEPTRLRLLDLLAQQPGPVCVCDITPRLSCGQSTVSHHLRVLREAGLVDTVHRGVWSYFWATTAGRQAFALARRLGTGPTQARQGAAAGNAAFTCDADCVGTVRTERPMHDPTEASDPAIRAIHTVDADVSAVPAAHCMVAREAPR